MLFSRHTKRREFITLLGGAVVAWPLAARAQHTKLPVIGFLHTGSLELNAKLLEGFRKGLAQGGFVEGRNVDIEFRWAEGREERLPVSDNLSIAKEAGHGNFDAAAVSK
jgi:putative ABC transport system substrate-binding protein